MKLPTINMREARPWRTVSPQAAAGAELAKSQTIAEGLGAIGEEVERREQQREEAEALRIDAEYTEEITRRGIALSRLGDKVTANELRILGADESNTDIPWTGQDGVVAEEFNKHDVEYALMKQVLDNKALEYADKLPPAMRDSWLAVTRENNANQLLSISNRNAREAEAHRGKMALANLERLSSPEARMEYAQASPDLDPVVAERAIQQARGEMFIRDTNHMVNNGTDAQLESHLAQLKDPAYRAKQGVSESTLQQATKRAESELAYRVREQERLEALADREREELARGAARGIAEASKYGVPIPEEEMDRALRLTQGTDYHDDVRRIERVSRFALEDAATRTELLQDANNFDEAADYGAMRAANDALNRAVQEDGFRVAVEQGIITDVAPMDLTDPEWGRQRQRQANVASLHYGMPVSPFTQREVEGISRMLPQMTTPEKVNMAMAFGEMPEVWPQFAKSGADVFAWVGATGDRELANLALSGQAKLDAGTVVTPSNKELLLQSNDYLADVYGTNDKVAVLETTKALYAELAPVGTEGDFDPDAWEQALEHVTGGIHTINGGRIAVPRGTDPDVMQDYVDKFDARQVRRFGGVAGMEDEQAAELIRDGQWVSVGENRYQVRVGGLTLMSGMYPLEIEYTAEDAKNHMATSYSRGAQMRAQILRHGLEADGR